MFKNPIKKYQNGGSVNQNQAMQQVVEFISQVAKVSPEEVMATLDKIKGDEDAINALSQALELAKNNDERGFQAIQLMFNPKTNTQFAKDGGKLHDFICKHAKGGYVAGCGCKEDGGKVDNKGYTAQVNAPGDTTRTKQYNYRQEIMQTYPDGSVRYTTRTTGGEPTEIHTWGPEGIPNIWRRLWFGNRQANPETVDNWRNIIANHPEDPRNVLNQENGGVVKAEEGTGLSRKEALEQSKATHGYNNAQAQTAYINAKNALRRQGLRGSALKQAAREMIAKSQSQNNPIQSVGAPSILQSTLSTPQIKPNVPEAKPINYDNMSFGEAFKIAAAKADNGEPKTFIWRGKSYGTRKASGPKLPVISDDIEIEYPEIDLTIPEIKVEQLHVPIMGTTPAARSIRTINTTPFVDSISGAGWVVSRVPIRTTSTNNSNRTQPRPTTGPMKSVQTTVGTGYYPVNTRGDLDTFVGRSEYEMKQQLNQDNKERMPSLRWGRWDYHPMQAVESNIPRGQVVSQAPNLIYRKKGGIVKGQDGSVINYYKNKLNNDFFV